MILSDKRILEEMDKGTIKIVPYQPDCLGSNSYDVHLGKHLARYVDATLDARKHNTIEHFDIPEDGNHCCHNLYAVVRPRMADWLAGRLGARI